MSKLSAANRLASGRWEGKNNRQDSHAAAVFRAVQNNRGEPWILLGGAVVDNDSVLSQQCITRAIAADSVKAADSFDPAQPLADAKRSVPSEQPLLPPFPVATGT